MKTKKSVAIYAHVSTDKQQVDMQLAELRELVKRAGWRISGEFIDKGFTGKNTRRPAFNKMMIQARQRKFDVLCNGFAYRGRSGFSYWIGRCRCLALLSGKLG